MNDGMYTNIRNYLEEIASKQGQIIAGQTRTNELLEKLASAQPTATTEAKPLPDAIGPVTVETVKEEPLKTTETVEVKDSQPVTSKSKKKPTKPDNKEDVGWNS